MNTRTKISRRTVLFAVLAAVAAAPAAAHADVTPTTQAKAADATWLPYVPAPAEPGAVCYVDSGLTPNGDISSAVLARVAVDPAQTPDDALGQLEDGSLYPHGTLMAMVGASTGAWSGVRGMWPAGKIVSVNGLPAGEHQFPIGSYTQAIERCLALAQTYPIHDVELALGRSGTISGLEESLLENAVTAAHNVGINVVAAAGNDPGPVDWPAAFDGIIAVAAGDPTTGGLCGWAANGPEVDVITPGCDVDEADPLTGIPEWGGGTSQASSETASVDDAIASYAPELTAAERQADITDTANAGHLDVAAAFRAAGLGALVDAAQQAEQSAEAAAGPSTTPDRTPPASTSPSPPPPVVKSQPDPKATQKAKPKRPRLPAWQRPRATFHRSGRTVAVRVAHQPKGARLSVAIQQEWEFGWGARTRRVTTRSAAKLNIRPAWQRIKNPLRVQILYTRDSRHSASAPLTIRLR